MLPDAAPIEVLGQTGRGGTPTDPVDRGLLPTAILQTGPTAWVETDLKTTPPTFDPSVDGRGPVVVGVAVSRRPVGDKTGGPAEEKPRLVLFSCATFAENLLQDIAPSNLDMLMNAASWLRERPDTLGIAPKTHVALTLAVDDQLRSRLIMVPSATAVMLIIAMGITVYVARRE